MITPKYLNEINIIIGLIILKPPSCFLSGMRDFSSVYSPTLHRKRQGSICHDEQVAYRPLIYGERTVQFYPSRTFHLMPPFCPAT